jgi:hypothetical protein
MGITIWPTLFTPMCVIEPFFSLLCMQAQAVEAPAKGNVTGADGDAGKVSELQAALDKAVKDKSLISRQLDEVTARAGFGSIM